MPTRTQNLLAISLSVISLSASFTQTVIAQEPTPSAGITVELNTVTQAEAGCQLTFVASSGHPDGVESVVLETVLFETSGAVNQLTLFDFGAIPAGVPRVRQFVVPGLQCASLGRLLINGVSACSVPGLDDGACAAGLSMSSRTDVEVLG